MPPRRDRRWPFAGTVTFTFGIVVLNHVALPQRLPSFARPRRLSRVALPLSGCCYLVLMLVYLGMKLFQ